MRVVMTGARGFIGLNLAHHLRAAGRGAALTGVDRHRGAPEAERGLFAAFHSGCFTDAAALELAADADAVVHLAADVSVQESLADPLATFENNAMRSLRLLDHLRRHAPQTHVIFASTGGVAADGPDGGGPTSPYAASKLAAEALLAAYAHAWGLPVLTLRLANVYGPFSHRSDGVIPRFCRRVLEGKPLRLNGDGRQTRDFIHVEDICQAIAGALETRAVGHYQLGTGVATSLNELVQMLRHLAPGRRVEVVHGPGLAGELRDHCADTARARRELGFSPRIGLREGLRCTLDWYRQELAGGEPWRLTA
ncbi:NAD-dependent epimerase/dehydratase family protein [Vannielia litorea]|uniref:UDP-glucose 4-epimerase n=1 Tax=Vannielia litorea TaxID=1217970 RepID=A0A1N6HMK8_9RHOB|nr:NAD-dependent epimerase/dehydratase family protein [Vannielia litorea]SIO21001.1 UDP-glucose 4-epimerase [Vannielia litorea]